MQSSFKALVIHSSFSPTYKFGGKSGRRWSVMTNEGASITHTGFGAGQTIIETHDLPDVVILDVAKEEEAGKFELLAKTLRRTWGAKSLPTIVLGAPSAIASINADCHLDAEVSAETLTKRCRELVRLATMQYEYLQRRSVAGALGTSLPAVEMQDDIGDARIMVLADGQTYFKLSAAFGGKARLSNTTKIDELLASLRNHEFEAVVVDSGVTQEINLLSLADLKKDVQYFTLPIIFINGGVSPEILENLRETGIHHILTTDKDEAGLTVCANYALSSVREERFRRDLTKVFKSKDFSSVRDADVGVFSDKFFMQHASRLLAHGKEWNRGISFAGIKAIPAAVMSEEMDPDILELVQEEASEMDVFRQIGRTIEKMVRVEDCVGYLGDGNFIIIAPNTTSLNTSVLIGRIGAVLRATSYSNGFAMTKAEIDTCFFMSRPGDTIDDVLPRLLS